MLAELKEYIETKPHNYEAGLQLLERTGQAAVDLKMLRQFKNSFTEGKLISILKHIYKYMLETPAAPTAQISSAEIAPPPAAAEDVKDTVIRLMEEKSMLFKEALNLRKALKKSYPLLYRGSIDLGSVLDIMDTYDRNGRAVPFSIVCVTYNEALQTGGEILHYPKAQLAVMDKSNRIASGKRAQHISNKDPNHWVNGTRNIRPYESKEVRTISIWTIIQFNEMEVNLGNIG